MEEILPDPAALQSLAGKEEDASPSRVASALSRHAIVTHTGALLLSSKLTLLLLLLLLQCSSCFCSSYWLLIPSDMADTTPLLSTNRFLRKDFDDRA